ncbi:MAG TPA: hypothetical protein VKS79_06155 [Gemmataceae bacterium]|nr:hypothetical protein [Gemmataceae bacterium]
MVVRNSFLRFGLAVGLVLTLSAIASACPFCNSTGRTLTQEAADAKFIVFGTLANPKFDPAAQFQGTTDLVIENIVKPDDFLKDKKSIELNRYLPVDKNTTTKYLVFCDIFNGKLDAYRGVALRADSKIAEYLKGALAVKNKDVVTRLRFFFDYLDSGDIDISNDAYLEFALADYRDYRPLAEKLPPNKLVKWLQDENTPLSRYGLYGSMLGHCGKPEHAAILKKLIDDPNRRFGAGIDGMLAGLVMLEPKDGWKYMVGIFSDPKKDFLLRFSALRAVRFLREYRPDLVKEDQMVAGVTYLLEQDDIADMAIEDLRKWQRWELTDKILGLFERKTHDVPIIKRAILRFALSAPAAKYPQAANFVTAMRKKDAEWVQDVEELLQLEMMPKPVAKPNQTAPAKPLTK